MDIVEFTKKIHSLEAKHDFFNIKDQNGLAYWDIVRHDVFYAVYYELANIQSSNPPPAKLYSKLGSIIKKTFYSLRAGLQIKPAKHLFFISSRYKNEFQENIDYAIADILALTKDEDRLIIDSVIRFGEKYHYNSVFNLGLVHASYKHKFKRKPVAVSYEVVKVLAASFGVKIDLNQTISSLITTYKTEYQYYRHLLKKVRPQKVFVVQNGIQKALFTVANEWNIPILEVQHGLVSFIHPAYGYPDTINYEHLNTFPKYFLTFSAFWTNNVNYPVKKILSVGNNFFSRKLAKVEKQYDLTFISANIYAKEINALIHSLLDSKFNGKIALKLHPNQYEEIASTKMEFEKFPKVTVIYNEVTIKEVLQLSQNVLAVQSTCVYEALDNDVKVFIYKIKDYRTHEDVFGNPNVYQISDVDEMYALLQQPFVSNSSSVFFEDFDPIICNKLIKTDE